MARGKRRLFGLSIPMLLIGLGFVAAAYFSYVEQNTGPETTATVASCTGTNSRFGPGIVCQGTWIVGGALVGGNGHVVFGDILDAEYSDIGHTISVHLHGGDAYSTKNSLRVPIIFLVIALPGLYIGIRALVFGVPDSWRAKSARRATSA
jgi:hypothetical protein